MHICRFWHPALVQPEHGTCENVGRLAEFDLQRLLRPCHGTGAGHVADPYLRYFVPPWHGAGAVAGWFARGLFRWGCWAAIRVAAGHAVGHVAVLFADSALRRGSTFAATLCAKRGLSALSRTAICTIVPLYCHGCMCCLRLHSVNDLHAHRNAYVRARWAAYTHIGGHIYIYVCVVCYIFRIHELVNTLMHCIDFNMGLAEVISSTRSHPNSVVPMQHIYLLLVVLFALVVLAVRFLEGRKFMGSGLLIVAVGDHQCIVR